MDFRLDEEESEKLRHFLDGHDTLCKYYDDGTKASPPGGAIGGRLTFHFTPTSLGTVIKVTCACGGEIDLTNYGDW